MKKLKIAVYSGDIPSTTFIENLIEGLADSGFEIYLFGKLRKKVNYKKNVKVFPTPMSDIRLLIFIIKESFLLLLKDPGLFFRTLQKIREREKRLKMFLKNLGVLLPILNHRTDIFHIQWAKVTEMYPELFELLDSKFALSLRGAHINYSPLTDEKLATAYRKIFPRIDGFHAVSEAIGKEAQKYGAEKNKIRVIHSSVKNELLEKNPDVYDGNQILELISIGRFHWKKGYHYALDAVRILKDKGININYTIVAQGEIPEEILFMINEYKIKDNVKIIQGLPYEELIEKLMDSHLLLLPSVEEGIANVVLEAMAVGIPVLTTDCGGMNEAVKNKFNGYIIPVRSPECIYSKVLEFTNSDREFKKQIISNAKRTIREEFSRERQIRDFSEFYIINVRRMTIGLVIPGVPQYSETFLNYKIKGLQESGFEVIVFSGKKTKEKLNYRHKAAFPVYEGKPFKQIFSIALALMLTFVKCPSRAFKLFSLERKGGRSIKESLKIIYFNAHILPFNLDWLHFGFTTMTLKRENVSKAIGSKMGISFRGYGINVYPLKHPGCYDKLWMNVDKVHSISDYLRDKAIVLGLSPKTPFEKITPAIDSSLFESKKYRDRFTGQVKILTVGRLNWIKDYETSISAMKKLKEAGVNFIYNIIGSGSEFERLKFAVHQCGLDDRVFFLGSKGHKEVLEMMRESDIYIQTSLQEGFCVSVLEAQATGLLSIVSDADGLKENVIDGKTGWIVKRREPKAFAEKIIEVINLSSSDKIKVADAAKKRAEEDFRIEDQKKKFVDFFSE